MFRFTRPDKSVIRRFIETQSALELTYPEVGATRESAPSGYAVDDTRIMLGSGETMFRKSQVALRSWTQFKLGWIELCWPETRIEPDQTVAVLAHSMGLWSLNACRIIYVVQEAKKFGFAYGTLPGHVECGEERFVVQWNEDDSVWYHIHAFSRPNHLLTRVGFPFTRRVQRRFATDSAARMKAAVTHSARGLTQEGGAEDQ